MVVFADMSFEKKDWHPTNLRLCKRGEWNVRFDILVQCYGLQPNETGFVPLSMAEFSL
jgi:hypothetical protein